MADGGEGWRSEVVENGVVEANSEGWKNMAMVFV
jgi:hypothetical protein